MQISAQRAVLSPLNIYWREDCSRNRKKSSSIGPANFTKPKQNKQAGKKSSKLWNRTWYEQRRPHEGGTDERLYSRQDRVGVTRGKIRRGCQETRSGGLKQVSRCMRGKSLTLMQKPPLVIMEVIGELKWLARVACVLRFANWSSIHQSDDPVWTSADRQNACRPTLCLVRPLWPVMISRCTGDMVIWLKKDVISVIISVNKAQDAYGVGLDVFFVCSSHRLSQQYR